MQKLQAAGKGCQGTANNRDGRKTNILLVHCDPAFSMHRDHHRASTQTRELFSTRGGGGGAAHKRITARLVCSSSHNGLVGAWLHPSNVHPPCPAIIEVNRRSILFLIDYFSPRSSPPLHPSICSQRRVHPGSCAAGKDTSIYVGTIAWPSSGVCLPNCLSNPSFRPRQTTSQLFYNRYQIWMSFGYQRLTVNCF